MSITDADVYVLKDGALTKRSVRRTLFVPDVVEFRVMGNGTRLLDKFMTIDPSIITLLNVISWYYRPPISSEAGRPSIVKGSNNMYISISDNYELISSVFMLLNCVVTPSTINNGERDVYQVVFPFTLPRNFSLDDGYLMYQEGSEIPEGSDALALDVTDASSVSAYMKSYNTRQYNRSISSMFDSM